MSSSEVLSKVGRKKPAPAPTSLLLLFVTGDYPELERIFRQQGYTVVAPTTADQAVALCLHNRFHAALLDEGSLAQVEDWSVAQSLRMVSPKLPVLMLVRGLSSKFEKVPLGVSCVVDESDPFQVLKTLRLHIGEPADTK